MTPEKAIDGFLSRIESSAADNTLVRLALSSPVPGNDAPPRLLGRLILLRGEPHLSFTFRHATRDVTRNLPLEAGLAWLRGQLGHRYRSALLGTAVRDLQLVFAPNGAARIVTHRPADTTPPPREHDQPRDSVLDASSRDWLIGLGVMNKAGTVRAAMADKYRQINRYLEICLHLARDCGWTGDAPGSAGDDASSRELIVADMGCGKGYLTFGLWHLLNRALKRSARVIGVEARPDLVDTTNRLARQIGAAGLEFRHGSIASLALPPLDALVALHACNTATDDALRRGIELGARLILTAPCCHQEIRPQLGQPEPLAPILRHGLMAERLAEWLTDGLRALYLEWAGYRTKMIEFVDPEHTPRNLLIAAVRNEQPSSTPALRRQIEELKRFFGLKHHTLDSLLDRDDAGSPAPTGPGAPSAA